MFPNFNYLTPQNFGADISQSVMGTQMAMSYIGIMLVPDICGVLGQFINMGIHLQQPSAAVPASEVLSDTFTVTSPTSSQPPVLELTMADATLRIPHGTIPVFLGQILLILKGLPC